jgi:hypothetical protein
MATVRMTEAGLRQAMRDRRHWQAGHPERHAYVNSVTEGWHALVDAERSGGTREVHVRSYSRVRAGRTEHVDSTSRPAMLLRPRHASCPYGF